MICLGVLSCLFVLRHANALRLDPLRKRNPHRKTKPQPQPRQPRAVSRKFPPRPADQQAERQPLSRRSAAGDARHQTTPTTKRTTVVPPTPSPPPNTTAPNTTAPSHQTTRPTTPKPPSPRRKTTPPTHGQRGCSTDSRLKHPQSPYAARSGRQHMSASDQRQGAQRAIPGHPTPSPCASRPSR